VAIAIVIHLEYREGATLGSIVFASDPEVLGFVTVWYNLTVRPDPKATGMKFQYHSNCLGRFHYRRRAAV